ncbi:MAG: NAD(P)/FAD-dependent oxidoreductase [Lentisphaeraceae bacterium]|nr:NAD(P)/FAD-dependent oxidoreductase [Lentisphaeraceae bacterium]
MSAFKKYKVVIVGGGPAGSACAIALANQGMTDVLLLEAGEHEKFRIGESIPPETRSLFVKLGIYQDFLAEKHDPCFGSCSFWGDERRGYNDSIMSPFGNGWHLDRRRFNSFLMKKAEDLGVIVKTNQKFSGLTRSNGQSSIHCEGVKEPVVAEFVVDATGKKSLVSTAFGSEKMHSYPIICLAARFSISDTHDVQKMTHLESVDYGWWYSARLPGNQMLITLNTDSELIRSMGLQNIETWLKALANTANTSRFLKGAELVDSSIKSFAAPSFCLDRVVGEDWLAVGDAASAYDPVTSQGIIKSLSNALEAADTILAEDKGTALLSYEKRIVSSFDNYLKMQHYFYSLENRWPSSSFWQKRQGQPLSVLTV